MFRFLARFVGVLLVAAGFVGLVVDGTRSIANGVLTFTPISDVAATVAAARYAELRPALVKINPALWDPVAVQVLAAPVSPVAVVLGLLLLWLGRTRPETIGHLAGR